MKPIRVIAVYVIFLVVLSTLVVAEDCGFFCQVENWLREKIDLNY